MTTYEGPKFPWGKVLGFLAPIVVIIVIIIARTNSVDDAERLNRARSMTLVTSVPATATTAPAIQTAVAEAVKPVLLVDGTPVDAGTGAGSCNQDYVGLDESVDNAITKQYELNIRAIEESSSPEEYIGKRSEVSLQVAQVWRDTANGAGASARPPLLRMAELWTQNTTIAADDATAQAAHARLIADTYDDLADEFAKCDATRGFASDLRQEAASARGLANELG